LSVPVLSWLFIAHQVPRAPARRPRPPPLPVASAHSAHRREGECAQPSEPILLANVRIYFADFPYLHCSIN